MGWPKSIGKMVHHCRIEQWSTWKGVDTNTRLRTHTWSCALLPHRTWQELDHPNSLVYRPQQSKSLSSWGLVLRPVEIFWPRNILVTELCTWGFITASSTAKDENIKKISDMMLILKVPSFLRTTDQSLKGLADIFYQFHCEWSIGTLKLDELELDRLTLLSWSWNRLIGAYVQFW